MCKVHSHKMAVLANQTIGDCPGSSPRGCPAASLPLLSLARQGGISPRSNTCSRRRKSFRREAPSHWGVRRHTRLETPVCEDSHLNGEPGCRSAGGAGSVVRVAGSRALPGAFVPSVWHRHGPLLAACAQAALRPRRPGLPGAALATSSASAERSCRLPSGGTALRVYMRNHMVTSSSWWPTRRLSSSAVELPHRCEMKCGACRSKAGCSGAWLPRQQAAEQRPLGREA